MENRINTGRDYKLEQKPNEIDNLADVEWNRKHKILNKIRNRKDTGRQKIEYTFKEM